MKKLKKIYVEITNTCNLNCSFCSKVEKPKRMMTPEEVEKTRSQLLAYCKLDTFAMVKLWEELNKTVNNI